MRLFFIIIFFCLFGNSPTISAQLPQLFDFKKGLILHYLFNYEDLYDESGNNNNIAPKRMLITQNALEIDSLALLFKKTRLTAYLSKPIYSDSYSISFWIKPETDLTAKNSSEKIFFIDWAKKGFGLNDCFSINYNNGFLIINIKGIEASTGKFRLYEKPFEWNFNKDEWSFINYSFTEKGNVILTINGGAHDLGIFSNFGEKFSNLNQPLFIGADGSLSEDEIKNTVGNSYFNGAFDDLRIFNRVLSNDEVARLYLQKSEEYTPTTITWENPKSIEIDTDKKIYSLKNCIETDTPLNKLQIFINEKLFKEIKKFAAFKPSPNSCTYSLENEIRLNEGENRLKIFAFDDEGNGEGESEERIINYVPIKNIVSNSSLAVNPSDIEIPNFNEKRKALVIGNSEYESSAKLRNPVNDAIAMAIELKKLGFEVIQIENGNRKQILEAISDYSTELAKDKNTTGLFYYAGHGIQAKGKNYLIPIDAKIVKEADIQVSCIDLDNLMVYLEEAANNMNLIILDACRNNPYGRSFRSSVGNGLATVTKQPKGTFLAYATAPGTVAADGTGENGLYTAELIKALEIPKLKLEDVFKRVRANVSEKSQDQQIPWDNSSLVGDFYFKKK